MRRDSRLSMALQALLEANPVLLTASKGHGGGWLLAKPLKKMRLKRGLRGARDEQAVNRALAYAERVLRQSFAKVTVDALANDVRRHARTPRR